MKSIKVFIFCLVIILTVSIFTTCDLFNIKPRANVNDQNSVGISELVPKETWQSLYGGTGDESTRYVREFSNGDYLVVATTTSADITSPALLYGLQGGQDIYLARISNNGTTILWHTMLGGSADDLGLGIDITSSDEILVTGTSYSTSVVGPALQHVMSGGCDWYVAKLNGNGAILWQTMVGGSSWEQPSGGIKETSDGGFILSGYSWSSDPWGPSLVQAFQGDRDIYVVKMTSSGGIEWQTMLGSSGFEIGLSVAEMNDGGFIAAGRKTDSNPVAGPPLLQGYHGSEDSYIIKLNSTGHIVWQTLLGGSGIDLPMQQQDAIFATDDGGCIILNYSDSSSVDGPALLKSHNGMRDAYIVKLNSSGTIQWQTMFGGSDNDYFYSCIEDLNGNLILCGLTLSTDLSGPVPIEGNHGNYDVWLGAMDFSGNLIWQTMHGGLGNDAAYGLIQDKDSNLVVGGYSDSDINSGPELLNPHSGGKDILLMKLKPDGSF